MKTLRLLLLSFVLAAGARTMATHAAELPLARFAVAGPILETPATPTLNVRDELTLEAGFQNPPG